MAGKDDFTIETKLKIAGVEAVGNLDAGTLKFKVDTSALKKVVQDAGKAAEKVKAKFNNLKLKKIKVELNQNSLKSVESQIKNAIKNAIKKVNVNIGANVTGASQKGGGGSKADTKMASNLDAFNKNIRDANAALRTFIKTMTSAPGTGATRGGAIAAIPSIDAGGNGGAGGLQLPKGAVKIDLTDIKQMETAFKDAASTIESELNDLPKDALDKVLDIPQLRKEIHDFAKDFKGTINQALQGTSAQMDQAKKKIHSAIRAFNELREVQNKGPVPATTAFEEIRKQAEKLNDKQQQNEQKLAQTRERNRQKQLDGIDRMTAKEASELQKKIAAEKRASDNRLRNDQRVRDARIAAIKREIAEENRAAAAAKQAKDRIRAQLIRNREDRLREIRQEVSAEKRQASERISDLKRIGRELDTLFQKEMKLSQNTGVPVGGGGSRGGGGGGGIPPGSFGGAGFGGGKGDRGAGSLKNLRGAMMQVNDAAKQGARNFDDLDDLAFEVGRKAAAFRGVAIAINSVIDAARGAVSFVINFNDELKELNKILQVSAGTLQIVGQELFDLSKTTGVAVDETFQIAQEFARAGLSGRGYGTVVKLTEEALKGYQGTTLDAAQSTQILIQVIQQVEAGARGLSKELITTGKLFDVLGRAEDITASKAQDVAEALKRSAASLFATGASAEEVTAVISVLQERTQRGGEVIGTALKTLASRISNSSSTASQALRDIGVETIDAQGKLRNVFAVLQDTATAFKTLSEAEQANIAVAAAGVRQVEIFRSALLDFNRVQDVQSELSDAAGDAARKQAVEQEKLSVVLQKVGIQLQNVVRRVSESELGTFFVGAIQKFEEFLGLFNKLDSFLGGSVSKFATIVALFGAFKAVVPLIRGMSKAFSVFLFESKEANTQTKVLTTNIATAGSTVTGKLNTSLMQTASVMNELNAAMAQFDARTEQAAIKAERIGAARKRAATELSARGGSVSESDISRRAGSILRDQNSLEASRVAKSRMGGMAQLVAQGKGADLVNAARTAPGAFTADELKRIARLEASVAKEGGRLSKTLTKVGGGMKSLVKNSLALGVGLSLVGGLFDALSTKAEGAGGSQTGLSATLGVAGGAAQGAALGALFGPVGIGVGAALGGLVAGFSEFQRSAKESLNTVEGLTVEYQKLGLVMSENGQISSELGEKLDVAFRNIEALRGFALSARNESSRRGGLSPEEAAKEEASRQRTLESAFNGLRAAIDSTTSAEESRQNVLAAASRVLKAQTGSEIDLTDEFLRDSRGAAGQEITKEVFNAIGDSLLELVPGGELRQEITDKIRLLGARVGEELTPGQKLGFLEDFEKNLSAFAEDIGSAGFLTGDPARAAFAAVAGGNEGETTREDLKREREKAATIGGEPALKRFDEILRRAEKIALEGRIGRGEQVAGGVALQKLLDDTVAIIAKATIRAETEAAKIRRAEFAEIQKSGINNIGIRVIDPLSRAAKNIGKPINALEKDLRGFISDFGKEVSKLREATLRASTPQKELADALVKFSADSLSDSRERKDIEETGAIRSFVDQINQLPGGNRAIGLGRGGEVLPGFTEEEARKTVSDVRKELVGGILEAIKEIRDQQITDPRQQGNVLKASLQGVSNLSPISEEERGKILDQAKELGQQLVSLDADIAQKRTALNSALVQQLRNTLAEEQKALAVNAQRREIISLNAQAAMEELTGIRRLVSERRTESQITNEVIGESKNRIASLNALIAVEKEALAQDDKNVAARDKLAILQEEQTQAAIELEKQLAQERISSIKNALAVSQEAISRGRAEADFQKGFTTGIADIVATLSISENKLDEFNSKLRTNSKTFEQSSAALAAETAIVNATITDEAEKKARLTDIQRRGIQVALEAAKAEAEVVAQRKEAVKQIAGELLGNQQQQVEAQGAIIEATKGVSEAFESYLSAVDGAILATTQYNLNLELVNTQNQKLLGGFAGVREELDSVQDIFRDAEMTARNLGASENILVQIRRDSINQQLALFNQLLTEQSSLARSFFQSSTQDQAGLFMGIKEAQSIAETLGGSFQNFKKLGEGAINDLGAQILSLPQETRQRIVGSLETLRQVGGEVGGFTADELLTAIETASLGVSGEGLNVDPLFEVQSRIAELTQEQALIATDQLIASQEQVTASKEQLEQAQAAKDLAEIQLERMQEEGSQLRSKLSELRGGLETQILNQTQTQQIGFNNVSSAILRMNNAMINTLPSSLSVKIAQAFSEVLSVGGLSVGGLTGGGDSTAGSRGADLARQQRRSNSNLAELRQRVNQSGPAIQNSIIATGERSQRTGSNLPGSETTEETNRLLADVVSRLESIESATAASNETLTSINENSGSTTSAASISPQLASIPDINVNIQGQQQITVTGFETGVQTIVQGLTETFGEFVTETQATNIANEVVSAIRLQLERLGIIQRNQI